MTKSETLFNEFDTLQAKIELIVDDIVLKVTKEHKQFENTFFDAIASAKHIWKSREKSKINFSGYFLKL